MDQLIETPSAPPTRTQVKAAALFLGVVIVIAAAGSLASASNTEGWYLDVQKVAWNPPNWVFGPAWSVLYVLIAVTGFLIWRAGYAGEGKENRAKSVLWAYAIQLGLNAIWTPIFFAGYPVAGRAAWWAALIVIMVLIAAVIWLAIEAAQFSKAAAWIQVPYLLWLMFATSLNVGIIVLN